MKVHLRRRTRSWTKSTTGGIREEGEVRERFLRGIQPTREGAESPSTIQESREILVVFFGTAPRRKGCGSSDFVVGKSSSRRNLELLAWRIQE